MLDIKAIRNILPHRYPFLLVDKILEMELEKYIVGIKNVSINEPFFNGHFPQKPVMPGVLIIEAMAQVGGILYSKTEGEMDDKLIFFMAMDKVKFRRIVVPGDQLRLELTVLKRKRLNWRFRGQAFVDGQLAAEGILLAGARDAE